MTKSEQIPFSKRVEIHSESLVPVVKTLEKELGKDRAHALVRKGLANWAREAYAKIRKGFPGNPIGLIEMGAKMLEAEGVQDYEFLKRTEESVDFNVTRCKFADLFKNTGDTEIGYLIICELDFPMAKGLGPDVELKRTQTIMQGAAYCDFRYSIKKRDR